MMLRQLSKPFLAKIRYTWLKFNTFIFMIVTNITTNSDPARGPLSTIENELLVYFYRIYAYLGFLVSFYILSYSGPLRCATTALACR
jgi:hypothetical protein